MKIYVIYDILAQCPVRIMNFENDDIAIRFLESALKVPNSPFANNCKETKLFEIASYDDSLHVLPNSNVSSVSYVNLEGEEVKYEVEGRIVKSYDSLISRFLGVYANEKK